MDFNCRINVARREFTNDRLEDFIWFVFVNRSYIFINGGFKGQDRVWAIFLNILVPAKILSSSFL